MRTCRDDGRISPLNGSIWRCRMEMKNAAAGRQATSIDVEKKFDFEEGGRKEQGKKAK